MSKINNMKFGKKFLTGIVALSIVGSGIIGGFHLQKKNEINRIKGYLEDFLTEDNYVDLTKISKDYKIQSFNGEYLDDAMEQLDIDYVRISDTYIYDGSHVTPFTQVTSVNYDSIQFIDKDGTKYYKQYEPIRERNENGVSYIIPDGFFLEEVKIVTEPYRYNRLDNTEVVVRENDYEESYSLSLERKK